MIEIPMSAIRAIPDFEQLVSAHAAELAKWHAHMARVKEDEANNVEARLRHEKYPRPVAHHIIESAIDERFKPSYRIVDDSPTSEQILAKKKDDLFAKVTEAENAALASILPVAKRRFFAIRESEVAVERSAIARKLSQEAKTSPIDGDLDATIDERLCQEDKDFLKRAVAVKNKMNAISRVAALMHHDIEDLTADNIDAWQMTAFEV